MALTTPTTCTPEVKASRAATSRSLLCAAGSRSAAVIARSMFSLAAATASGADGVIVDHTVEQGNTADATQLAPAIARIARRAGRAPRTVTADRGYGEARVDTALHDLGVRTVAIPRKGQPGPVRRATEHRRSFRRLVKWRTGCEGRIAHLNADPAGTAPCSTGSPEPGSGADTASSPTTSPRSAS
jgi:IS5 family transposase